MLSAAAQDGSKIYGTVTNNQNEPVSFANVSIENTSIGTVTSEDGVYELNIPGGQKHIVIFSHVSYNAIYDTVFVKQGSTIKHDAQFGSSARTIGEVSISADQSKISTLKQIEIKDFDFLPSTTGSFEAVLKTMGVGSRNELSSQYTVRGGNFDENLVYVNDIEIYRPFLIRSGQQEGLSFTNPDLVSSVHFSAGGFASEYGDKMSSVLDIQYKRPKSFGGSTSLSLLGGSFHLEGASKNNRFTHITGVRYKTSQYLLGSLETTGEYNPSFVDVQSFLTYDLTPKLELALLGNYALNQFNFIPETRTTTFGTIQNALNLNVYYEGQEKDRFETILGALSLNYRHSDILSLKFIASSFQSNEQETFDILGAYSLNAIDNQIGAKTQGDSLFNLGVGVELNHARNYLRANVHSFKHKGTFKYNNNYLTWGAKYQIEDISDDLDEWDMIDSAGYSLPYSESEVNLWDVRKGDNQLVSHRISGYIQNRFTLYAGGNEFYLTAGVRGNYWSLNEELIISPRATFSYSPVWSDRLVLKASSGLYYQPPFYKELRMPDGTLYKDVKAQKSIHYVLGGDFTFEAWNRPFKLSTELYYKDFQHLIPYKTDNVRILYYPTHKAVGYAQGLEIKLNGEFVAGEQSWISLSFLKTEEDIIDDIYFESDPTTLTQAHDNIYKINPGLRYKETPGYYSRPTDQLFQLSMFFQDHLPMNPDYKVHLTMVYGTSLPNSNPNTERFDVIYKMPPYKRVDVGFSKIMIKNTPDRKIIKSLWLGGEILNLFGNRNTISYQWIKTVTNSSGFTGWYAVPNYLTARRFNIKVTLRF
jgi:hypothetical protein